MVRFPNTLVVSACLMVFHLTRMIFWINYQWVWTPVWSVLLAPPVSSSPHLPRHGHTQLRSLRHATIPKCACVLSGPQSFHIRIRPLSVYDVVVDTSHPAAPISVVVSRFPPPSFSTKNVSRGLAEITPWSTTRTRLLREQRRCLLVRRDPDLNVISKVCKFRKIVVINCGFWIVWPPLRDFISNFYNLMFIFRCRLANFWAFCKPMVAVDWLPFPHSKNPKCWIRPGKATAEVLHYARRALVKLFNASFFCDCDSWGISSDYNLSKELKADSPLILCFIPFFLR